MLLALFDLNNREYNREQDKLIEYFSQNFQTQIEVVDTPLGFVINSKENTSSKYCYSFDHCERPDRNQGIIIDGFLIEPSWSKYRDGFLTSSFLINKFTPTTFNGSYNIIQWDSILDTVIISNDRLGFRRLYYWVSSDNSRLVIASSLKILKVAVPNLNLNFTALAQQILLSSPTNGESLLSEVKVLQPGSSITLTKEGITSNIAISGLPWGEQCFNLNLNNSARLIVETAQEVLKSWVNSEHVTVSLSGGYDSRFLALLAKEHVKSLRAITLGTLDWIDGTIAHQFCYKSGIPHRICVPPKSTTIENYISIVRTVEHVSDYLSPFWLKKFSKAFSKDSLVINGFFGGPLTGSTIKWVDHPNNNWLLIVKEWYNQVNSCNVSANLLQKVCAFDINKLEQETFNDLIKDAPDIELKGYQKLFFLEWKMRQRGFVSFDTYNLFRTFSNVVVPFVDHRLLTLFTNLDLTLLIKQKAYIHAVQSIDNTNIPFASTSRTLLNPSTYSNGPQSIIENNFNLLKQDFQNYVINNKDLLSSFFNVEQLVLCFAGNLNIGETITTPQRLILINAAILFVELSR